MVINNRKRQPMERNVDASREIIKENQGERDQVAMQNFQEISTHQLNKPKRPYLYSKMTIPAKWKIEVSTLEEKISIREGIKAQRLDRVTEVYQKLQQKKKKKKLGQQCQVCCVFYDRKDLDGFGQCGHQYCKKCLSLHIVNSINNFKVVTCLNEDCSQTLDVSSPHIRSLALPLQEKYYKIRVFLNLAKDQDIRMCPTENCEGFIKQSDEDMRCPICSISFCRHCFLPQHSGSCDQNGVLFFEDNYQFQQCDRCKMVLERNQGCDHMTCKCGYQFCYLCGQKWASHHKCKPKEKNTKRSLPPLIFPQPSASVIRDNTSTVIRRQQQQQRRGPQQQQRSDARLQPPNNIQHQAAASNTSSSCLTSTLKIILVVVVHIISGQAFNALFFVIVAPIFFTIFFFLFSLGAGMKEMLQTQSCLKIALLNVFLYLFYVLTFFFKKYVEYTDLTNCRSTFNLSFLFPLSSLLYKYLNRHWP